MIEWGTIAKLTCAISAIGISATVMFLVAGSSATISHRLILKTACHSSKAATGNRSEGFLFVSAYNEAGPIRGLASGNIAVAVVSAPKDAAPVRIMGMTEPIGGIYKISVAPELSQQRWSSGMYVMGVRFISPHGSGVALAELVIKQ